ncbi:MAG: sulfite exporter TauE/SafE family protein [Planctomycetota bacterium]|nr:sulfite exporter TauE/SafE family protein [Planctomycetota bacterium]
MPLPVDLLLSLIIVTGSGFVVYWFCALRNTLGSLRPTPYQWFVGAVTDFFDTLGIGSFATTTTMWRARKTVKDEHIPGTLNVGHTLPTILQAYFYIDSVQVETLTLFTMIGAAIAGSLLGAPIVARLPRQQIQRGLGLALLVLCAVLVYRQFGDPTGGEAEGLSGYMLAIGILGNFVLGALMTIGVGLYAPCLLMVSLLGLNQKVAFPIMMGSCAFLMPLASVPFIRLRSYDARAALGLTLAGVPAVYIAAKLVKEMDLKMVKWLVAAVIIYTSISLLRAASKCSSKPVTRP